MEQRETTMRVEAPIFIIGTGRSGSSIFHTIFSTHPGVAWLSQLHAKHPSRLDSIKYIMNAIDYPLLGPRLRSKLDPGECYGLWEHICPGFSTPCRDLQAFDVTNRNRSNIQAAFTKIVSRKRNRLLMKLTGWSRINFIREIFPDAKFIHVVRDGRAVSNSTIQVDFWWGWRGPQNWRWGPLTEHDMTLWKKHDRSFVVLAGIQWKMLLDAIEEARPNIDQANFLEIKYEEFCEDPSGTFTEVIKFCNLDWSDLFEKRLASFKLRSRDFKWKEDLSVKQQAALEDVIGDHLRQYGYQ